MLGQRKAATELPITMAFFRFLRRSCSAFRCSAFSFLLLSFAYSFFFFSCSISSFCVKWFPGNDILVPTVPPCCIWGKTRFHLQTLHHSLYIYANSILIFYKYSSIQNAHFPPHLKPFLPCCLPLRLQLLPHITDP